MIKVFLQLFLFLFATSFVWAQDLSHTWLKEFQGRIKFQEVLQGKDSTWFAMGWYSGESYIGRDKLKLSGSGVNLFVARFSFEGQVDWVESFGDPSPSLFPQAMSIDSDDNILVTGFLTGRQLFGAVTLDPGGFVIKLNKKGELLWAKQPGVAPGSRLNVSGVETDADNNMYVTLQAYRPIEVNDTIFGQKGSTVLVKMNPDGDVIWAKGFENVSDLGGFCVDENKHIYLSFQVPNSGNVHPFYNNQELKNTLKGKTFFLKISGKTGKLIRHFFFQSQLNSGFAGQKNESFKYDPYKQKLILAFASVSDQEIFGYDFKSRDATLKNCLVLECDTALTKTYNSYEVVGGSVTGVYLNLNPITSEMNLTGQWTDSLRTGLDTAYAERAAFLIHLDRNLELKWNESIATGSGQSTSASRASCTIGNRSFWVVNLFNDMVWRDTLYRPLKSEESWLMRIDDKRDIATSDKKLSIDESIGFYPNPVQKSFSISAETKGVFRVEVYGTDGNLVLKIQARNDQDIPVHNIPPGMYLLRVASPTGEQSRVGKLMIKM